MAAARLSKSPGMAHFDGREWPTLPGWVTDVVVVVSLSFCSFFFLFVDNGEMWITGLRFSVVQSLFPHPLGVR